MLCPDCKLPAPGGAPCPGCGERVPERETFGGQGGHYLRVLALVSCALLAILMLYPSRHVGLAVGLRRLFRSGWAWLLLAINLAPLGIGLYYWFLLREEEIVVTDDYIARSSHWGDERLVWSDVQAFRRIPMLFSQTRLGRIAGLSEVLAGRRLLARLPRAGYELVGPEDAQGEPSLLRLEPGTIEDLPWLLQLIQERVGPPEEA
ncbi:MAG: hypothetical protein FJZ90_12855 [Chloroflexi bacterium]|nr:hypothetical protein [Chloroflexota bacterium]